MKREIQAPGTHESCESLLQAMIGFDTVNSAISGKPDAERALSVYLEGQAEAMGLDTRRLPVTGEGFNLSGHSPGGSDRRRGCCLRATWIR